MLFLYFNSCELKGRHSIISLFFFCFVLSLLLLIYNRLQQDKVTPFTAYYKTEVTSIIRVHQVYKEVRDAAIGEMLEATSDDREEAKEYDKYPVGLYKKDILSGHMPIEISSLCFHFINQDPRNKIKALTTRNRICRSGKVNFHSKQSTILRSFRERTCQTEK